MKDDGLLFFLTIDNFSKNQVSIVVEALTVATITTSPVSRLVPPPRVVRWIPGILRCVKTLLTTKTPERRFEITFSEKLDFAQWKKDTEKWMNVAHKDFLLIGTTPRAPGCNRHHQNYEAFLGTGIPT